jgi:hypothetical protein
MFGRLRAVSAWSREKSKGSMQLGGGAIADGETRAKNASGNGPLRNDFIWITINFSIIQHVNRIQNTLQSWWNQFFYENVKTGILDLDTLQSWEYQCNVFDVTCHSTLHTFCTQRFLPWHSPAMWKPTGLTITKPMPNIPVRDWLHSSHIW